MRRGALDPGRNYYGVDVGIVLVPTSFPRPRGDIGNARTFDFPVAYEVAAQMRTSEMLSPDAVGMVDVARRSAQVLLERGCRAVATSCGLMAKYQLELTKQFTSPVVSSSLVQIPLILDILPASAQLGVLTFDSRALLGGGHFDGLGLTQEDVARLAVAGIQDTEYLAPTLLDGQAPLDQARARAEVLRTGADLLRANPEIGALVLECTNLSPYSGALRRELGVPVWDVVTAISWLNAGYDEGGSDA